MTTLFQLIRPWHAKDVARIEVRPLSEKNDPYDVRLFNHASLLLETYPDQDWLYQGGAGACTIWRSSQLRAYVHDHQIEIEEELL